MKTKMYLLVGPKKLRLKKGKMAGRSFGRVLEYFKTPVTVKMMTLKWMASR